MATVTLEEVLDLAQQLSPVDKARLIGQVAPALARELTETVPVLQPRRSLYGIAAHLGPAPSAEEIDAARGEMWTTI